MAWSYANEYGEPSRKPGVPRRAEDGGGNPLHQRVLDLQATAGNQAVQRLIQQDAGEQAAGAAGGGSSGQQADGAPEVLRYGSRGQEVKRLQERLNQSGSAGAELDVDGEMGALTVAAVRRFQKAHPPLDVDGTVGPEVWAELERVGDQGAPLPGATAWSFFEKGNKLYEQRRFALAFDEFAKAHALDPEPTYLFNMAQALKSQGGRREEAIKLFERFIVSKPDAAELDKATAELAKLRGPGSSGDKDKDVAKVNELFERGKTFYDDRQFGRAYDEFTKAWEINHDDHVLWNRAVALRSLGGQRSQAIGLFEQVLTADVPEDKKVAARRELAELKGPGPSGDEKKDDAAHEKLFLDAQSSFEAGDYLKAYDGFTKAWQITYSSELVWNRAQALRLAGGRREEAIKLYTLVLASELGEEHRQAARVHIADLRGPSGATAGRPPQH